MNVIKLLVLNVSMDFMRTILLILPAYLVIIPFLIANLALNQLVLNVSLDSISNPIKLPALKLVLTLICLVISLFKEFASTATRLVRDAKPQQILV